MYFSNYHQISPASQTGALRNLTLDKKEEMWDESVPLQSAITFGLSHTFL